MNVVSVLIFTIAPFTEPLFPFRALSALRSASESTPIFLSSFSAFKILVFNSVFKFLDNSTSCFAFLTTSVAVCALFVTVVAADACVRTFLPSLGLYVTFRAVYPFGLEVIGTSCTFLMVDSLAACSDLSILLRFNLFGNLREERGALVASCRFIGIRGVVITVDVEAALIVKIVKVSELNLYIKNVKMAIIIKSCKSSLYKGRRLFLLVKYAVIQLQLLKTI